MNRKYEIPPEASEDGAFAQPLTSSHGCYGPCPECKSLHTIVRSMRATRVCLTCGFTEDFNTQDEAMVGWRSTFTFANPRTYCALTPPYKHKHEGD